MDYGHINEASGLKGDNFTFFDSINDMEGKSMKEQAQTPKMEDLIIKRFKTISDLWTPNEELD